MIEQCFTKEEIEYLQNQPAPIEYQKCFYKLWTAKESCLKALGKGFSINPKSLCVLPLENGLHKIGQNEFSLHFSEHDNHIICIAIKE